MPSPTPFARCLTRKWRLGIVGDIDGFMEGYAPRYQTTFVSGDEVTRGWQTVHDRYAQKYDSRGENGQADLFQPNDHAALRRYAMVLGAGVWSERAIVHSGKFTLLFRKLPEGWRIVLDHTS